MRPARFVLVFLIAALLGGCGFQLRGTTEIPEELSPVYVQTGPGSRVGKALHNALRANDVGIAASREGAATLIRILSETQDERINAVNSQGKVIAKDLIYQVSFDAVAADGGRLAERQSIKLRREHANPEEEYIGKAEEAELIRRDLAQDMADRILRRLKAQLL